MEATVEALKTQTSSNTCGNYPISGSSISSTFAAKGPKTERSVLLSIPNFPDTPESSPAVSPIDEDFDVEAALLRAKKAGEEYDERHGIVRNNSEEEAQKTVEAAKMGKVRESIGAAKSSIKEKLGNVATSVSRFIDPSPKALGRAAGAFLALGGGAIAYKTVDSLKAEPAEAAETRASISPEVFYKKAKEKLFPTSSMTNPNELHLTAGTAILAGECAVPINSNEDKKITVAPGMTTPQVENCDDSVEPPGPDYILPNSPYRFQSTMNELGVFAASGAGIFNFSQATSKIEGTKYNVQADTVCPPGNTPNISIYKQFIRLFRYVTGPVASYARSDECKPPKSMEPSLDVSIKVPRTVAPGKQGTITSTIYQGQNVNNLKVTVFEQSNARLLRKGSNRWYREPSGSNRLEYQKPTFNLGLVNAGSSSNTSNRKNLRMRVKVPKGMRTGKKACTALMFRMQSDALAKVYRGATNVCFKVSKRKRGMRRFSRRFVEEY